MAKDELPSYHLVEKDRNWRLEPEGGGRAKKVFDNKGDATSRGAMKDALGKAGGSVRIHKQDGEIQEERTYPRSKDPKRSPG